MISFANARVRMVGTAATEALVTGVGIRIASCAMAVPNSMVGCLPFDYQSHFEG